MFGSRFFCSSFRIGSLLFVLVSVDRIESKYNIVAYNPFGCLFRLGLDFCRVRSLSLSLIAIDHVAVAY